MGRKLVVLVVEDHPDVRDVLEEAVGSWADVELISCTGFIEATVCINEVSRIDLMLCDLPLSERMTGIDHIEILTKSHPEAAVVMTASDPLSNEPHFSERYGFVKRPFNRDQLIEAVDHAFVQLKMDAPVNRVP